MMQTLFEGVVEALNFINPSHQEVRTRQVFYGETSSLIDDHFVIEVNASKVPAPPQSGDVIELNGIRHKVISVEVGDDIINIEVERADVVDDRIQ